jgi:hypothetical protein
VQYCASSHQSPALFACKHELAINIFWKYIDYVHSMCVYFLPVRDKRAKFIELANKRVTKSIKELKLVGNLANKANYEFTDEEAKKIIRALQREVDSIRARFADTGTASSLDFTL